MIDLEIVMLFFKKLIIVVVGVFKNLSCFVYGVMVYLINVGFDVILVNLGLVG